MRNWNWGSWPWNPDTRDYSDVVVNAIQAMARGELTDTPPGSASSICRAAAQLTARVFGSVAVEGAGSARIDAHFLARAGLAAVYRGELFADVLVGNDAVTFDVALGVDEQLDRDRYRLELPPLRDSDSERLRIVDDPLHVVFNASPGLRGMPLWALQMQPWQRWSIPWAMRPPSYQMRAYSRARWVGAVRQLPKRGLIGMTCKCSA